MSDKEITTEDKILKAAITMFLLYGYHGTTIQQISIQVGVRQSVIHYYFRSKEKLYVKVVKSVLDNILEADINRIAYKEIIEKYRWFLFTELYNNQIFFEKTLKDLYFDDWDKKLNKIRELIII